MSPDSGQNSEKEELVPVWRLEMKGLWFFLAVGCSALEVYASDFSFTYKGDYSENLAGGLEKDRAFLHDVEVKGTFDAGADTAFHIFVLGNKGQNPSEMVGDAQGTSNIETTDDTIRLYEAWVEQAFFEKKVSVLAGLHDLNSDFYVTPSSAQFLNSSFGIGKDFSQTGRNGPSIFPVTAPAVRLHAAPSAEFAVDLGVFNGMAGEPGNRQFVNWPRDGRDGFLLVNELSYVQGSDGVVLPGKYAFGFYTYTDHHKRVWQKAGNETDTSHGAYVLVDQQMTERLGFFARYGVASPEVNRFGSCLGTGLVWKGLGGREHDAIGTGVVHAANTRDYIEMTKQAGESVTAAETTWEVYYHLHAFSFLAVQPDFQYVVHPDTRSDIDDARVFSVRVEVTL